MKAWDFEAVVWDGAEYCVECLPEGVDPQDPEEVSPIFPTHEADRFPVCDVCHEKHTYTGLTAEGLVYEAQSAGFELWEVTPRDLGYLRESYRCHGDAPQCDDCGSTVTETVEDPRGFNAPDDAPARICLACAAGWWYWACSPGCLPDSEPSGPFQCASEAGAEALEGLYF